MPGRPNKAIIALKKRDYKSTIWELILHEYRMAKAGNTENRLGPSALSSLISALKEINAEDHSEKPSANLIEVTEWIQKEGSRRTKIGE